MGIVRWNKISNELTRLQQEVNNLVDKYLKDDEEPAKAGDWIPAIDLVETDKNFLITAELPDIDPTNIDVNVSEDRLIIKGERRKVTEENDAHVHKIERSYGSFSRQIAIPAPVLEDQISADYENGVLRITLPKAEVTKSKSVKINVKK